MEQIEELWEALCKMEDFYRKKDGARELLTKKRKDYFNILTSFLGGKGWNGGVFLSCRLPSFYGPWDGEGPSDTVPHWC